MSVRETVLATAWDAWNHPRRALVALVVAAVASFFAGFVGESLSGPMLLEVVASALFIAASVLLAAAVLAVFD